MHVIGTGDLSDEEEACDDDDFCGEEGGESEEEEVDCEVDPSETALAKNDEDIKGIKLRIAIPLFQVHTRDKLILNMRRRFSTKHLNLTEGHWS